MRVASLVQFVAMLTAVAAQAQTPDKPASPCAAGAYREFDFWAGEWIVRAGSGEEVGRNSVQPDQQGCALIERWTARDGSTGISINFYDPVLRVWTQQWVSAGAVLTMTGGLKDGAMVLEGPLHYLKGRTRDALARDVDGAAGRPRAPAVRRIGGRRQDLDRLVRRLLHAYLTDRGVS